MSLYLFPSTKKRINVQSLYVINLIGCSKSLKLQVFKVKITSCHVYRIGESGVYVFMNFYE